MRVKGKRLICFGYLPWQKSRANDFAIKLCLIGLNRRYGAELFNGF